MSLFSLGLLAAYFAGGMQYMMNQEGWDAADAFYFWSRAVWKSTSELGCAIEQTQLRRGAPKI
jgi:hypothetical protein